MEKLKFIGKNIALTLMAASLLTSCTKKDTADEDNDTSSSKDNAFAESSYNDVANIADEAAQSGTVSSYKMGATDASLTACAVVTLKNTVSANQDTIIIDFGPTGCTGNDGRIRKGKVIVYYTGKYKTFGSTHTITFDNYYVNNNKVDGTKTVTNNGFNTSGHLNWTVSVNGTISLASGGGTITWTSTRTRELLGALGSAMLNSADTSIVWGQSKWGITGTASGTSAAGVSYSGNISKQIVYNMTCILNRRHPTEGTFEFIPSGKATRTVDFGNGTCDDQATVIIKGTSYAITLK